MKYSLKFKDRGKTSIFFFLGCKNLINVLFKILKYMIQNFGEFVFNVKKYCKDYCITECSAKCPFNNSNYKNNNSIILDKRNFYRLKKGTKVEVKSLNWFKDNFPGLEKVNNNNDKEEYWISNAFNIIVDSDFLKYIGKTFTISELIDNNQAIEIFGIRYTFFETGDMPWSPILFISNPREDYYLVDFYNHCENFCKNECSETCPLFKFLI